MHVTVDHRQQRRHVEGSCLHDPQGDFHFQFLCLRRLTHLIALRRESFRHSALPSFPSLFLPLARFSSYPRTHCLLPQSHYQRSLISCKLAHWYMQRGQARGRRRYSLSNRSASTRRTRSTPRSTSQEQSNSIGTSSQSRRAPSLLRRSARIVESLQQTTSTTQQSTTSTEPMADVARRSALGSRSVQSRHHGSAARTSGRSRSGHYSGNIQYAMDFIVQPPRTARAGYTIPGTVIVRLRTTNTDPDYAIADSPNLMAVVALIPGPNSTVSSDPHVLSSLLGGQRIASIHPFADDEADGSIASMDMAGPQGVGYMSFPGLAIHQAGTFRLRITLLRTADGAAIQVVDSNPFVVQTNGSANSRASHNGKYY